MGKSNHPCSIEIQHSDFHQGIVRRHRLNNLPHWAQEQEQEQELVSEEQGQGPELEMGLGEVGLVVVVVLVVVPLHQCNPSF